MESKNKTVLMTVIDTILEETVWVNKSGETISLKDAIARSIKAGKAGNVESLDRSDLLGAYTSFQIKRQSFAENTKNMTDKELADKIKLFIFEDTREQMILLERELELSSKERKTA
ncbi:MAG: hypothetical protein IJ638_02395 [Alphaproteobacteria bacterium]|nr:hypothetical protein [Alphaproteobacteria bacterium]